MKYSKIASLLLAVLFAVSADSARACVCSLVKDESIGQATDREFERASTVFVAKVVGLEFKRGIPKPEMILGEPSLTDPDTFKTQVVKFELERQWKGRLKDTIFATSVLQTDSGDTISSSCDFTFTAGQRYLVFANGTKGILRTGACSGTRELTGSADDRAVLEHLGSYCLPDDPDAHELLRLGGLFDHQSAQETILDRLF